MFFDYLGSLKPIPIPTPPPFGSDPPTQQVAAGRKQQTTCLPMFIQD